MEQQTILVDTPQELEVAKTVVIALQSIGKEIDKYYRELYIDNYEEKMTYDELLKTELGQQYVVIGCMIAMIAKNPNVALSMAPYLENSETLNELINSFELKYEDGKLSIESIDEQP